MTRLTLTEALDAVYGPTVDWTNPIRPYSVSGVTDTPFEAYQKLKPEFRDIVRNLIGHAPKEDEE